MDAADWDRRYTESPWPFTEEPNIFLVSEVGPMEPGRALDLGCGEGRNAVWLAERGWDVTGVDFSTVALDRARSLAARRRVEVRWVHADLQIHRPEPDGYDLVVVMYLQLPSGTLAEVLRHGASGVAPGGTMLVVGHDVENLGRGVPGPTDPDVLYTPERIAAALDGLEIERAERVQRAVERDGDVRTAIDTLVRAVAPSG